MGDGLGGRLTAEALLKEDQKQDDRNDAQDQGEDSLGGGRLVHAFLGAAKDIFELDLCEPEHG